MQRSNLNRIFLLLAFLTAFVSSASAEKNSFFEMRGGISGFSAAQISNRTHKYTCPSIDITFGGKIGYMQSVLNIGFFGATTNATQTINGVETNSRPTNRYFLARAFTLDFTEYFPFSFLGGKLNISPGVDIKFAHYNDISALTEFTKPTRDYMYTFLRLALKAEFNYQAFCLGSEFRYPLLGALTDKALKENRYETYFNIYGKYNYSTLYVKFGFDYTKLTYNTPLYNSAGKKYLYRSLGTLYLSLGVNF